MMNATLPKLYAVYLIALTPVLSEIQPIKGEHAEVIYPPPHSEVRAILVGQNLRSELGRDVTLDVHIEEVSRPKNGNIYLNIGGKFPDVLLTLVIFEKNLAFFGDVDIVAGENLRVMGKLTEYKGALQIIVESRKQIVRRGW
jgi:hypothetical protein